MRSLYLNDAACFSSSLITMRPLRFLSSPSLYQLVKPTPSLLSPLTSSPHCLSYPYQDHQCLLNIFPGKEMVPAFVLALISLLGACQSSSLASDGWVLASLKHSFQPADQLLLWSWDTSNLTTVCSWAGVRCMDERVVTLDISGLNLSGTISPLLAKLDRLRVLNISNNQFNGGLDLDFPSLVNLEVLDAYNNNLTAPLPLGIVACLKKLKYLDLGGNYFYGTIPSKYGSIITLEFMGLEGNDLTGRVPKELGNLTNLKQLALGHYNAFEGGIPAELGSLVSLVHLDLSECQLEGQIPPELGRLAELDTLYLYGNRLTGQIPKELGNLTNLAFMDLSINALTGQIPPEFVKFKGLRLFNLFMNRLHGSVPRFIADLPSLETLGLWMNNFTGVIPQSLGRYQKLQNLDLSSNKLTGTIPPNLCSSKQLEILILFNNFLFGPIPDSLGSCLTLVKVRMGQNYLNGSIPNTFLYLPDLHLMELHNNYLSGTLWENNRSVFSPTKIARLNLSNNQLTGPLPASFSNFTSLQILLLSDNQLTGLIPPELGELRQVLKMDLSRNSLSQSIPAEIGNCTELTYLDLSQNNLSGPIPTQISQIRILNYLNLSHNQLNQAIPRSIGAMKSLTVADFSFNDLSGKLPDNGQFAYFKASFFAGNPRLCGQVLNNPCNLTAIGTEPKRVPGDLKLVLALGLLISSLVFAGIAIAKSKSLKRSKSDSDSWRMTAFQKVDFAVADVLGCLTDSNVIGKGGAGVVYLGKLPDGEEVAVKKLPVFESHSHDHGFKAEIQTLGNIKHRNIVRLLAFCSNSQMNLLVYEYMRNGSLGEALHGKKGGLLGWDIRYKVALEAARGLCYLHHDCSPMIVHRDVKSNNILLNSNFEAHVADFGLAKFLRDGTTTEPMSAIAGSYGYIAPEYAYTLKVDEKSDVYSFGVVLLELLTGRRPVGEFGEGVDIVQWARRMTNGRCDRAVQILDPRLTVVPKDDAVHMFFVAMLCVQERSVERPTMREVVQMLSEFPRQQLSPTSSKSLPV